MKASGCLAVVFVPPGKLKGVVSDTGKGKCFYSKCLKWFEGEICKPRNSQAYMHFGLILVLY